MSHVIDFVRGPDVEERDLQQSINETLNDLRESNDWYVKDADGFCDYDRPYKRTFRHLFEVVLATYQVTGEIGQQRVDMLKRNGFKLVNRFVNDNSGNECFVFHRAKSLPLSGKTLPFKL